MLKLQVIGNSGADSQVNDVNGKKVVNFNLCHTERFKDANGVETNKSIWVNCSYWSDKTAIAQYIKKGTLLYVEGQPSTDTYTKDGKTFAQLRLRVTNVQLLGGSKENNQAQPQSQPQSIQTQPQEIYEDANDDLPF